MLPSSAIFWGRRNLARVDPNPPSWAQATLHSDQITFRQQRNWFPPQLGRVQLDTGKYPENHLLGIPLEIRDAMFQLLEPNEQVAGTRPKAGYENYQLVCRQTFHETSQRWNYQPTVLVPANRSEEFIARTLDVKVLESNAYRNVKALFFEIHHNAPNDFFSQMARILKHSSQLEELHLFGVGPDSYGVDTSSVGHGCGKHDLSVEGRSSKLQIAGQAYRRRLPLVNSLIYLANLKVLVLDNLNLPLLAGHVLVNKPRLEKLYIAADPRSMLHTEYKTCDGLDLRGVLFQVPRSSPPVKELCIASNAIFSATKIVPKVSDTLESLEYVLSDVLHQHYANKLVFLAEGAHLFSRLHLEARNLRELRMCVHGPISEDHHHYASFMGAFKNSVSLMQNLQLVEVHIHSKSPWFAQEFIEALPPSVTRLYVTDLLINKCLPKLCDAISQKTNTPLDYAIDSGADEIGEDLNRTDYIPFHRNQLAFVGYEFDLNMESKAARRQENDITIYLKLMGRMLDKERNRHLASLNGTHVPPREGEAGGPESQEEFGTEVCQPIADGTWDPESHSWEESADFVFEAEDEYFGDEDVAEMVFHREAPAVGGHYTYPAVLEVESEHKVSNHWLSK